MTPYKDIELSHSQYVKLGTLLDDELERIWNMLDKLWSRLRALEEKEQ